MRVASVRSRTDSRVTAVMVAASAAMVVATAVPLTVPRRSLLGCRSVPVVPHRTHVRNAAVAGKCAAGVATRAIDYAAARRRRRTIQRDIIAHSRLSFLALLRLRTTIFPSRLAARWKTCQPRRGASWPAVYFHCSDLRESRESASFRPSYYRPGAITDVGDA